MLGRAVPILLAQVEQTICQAHMCQRLEPGAFSDIMARGYLQLSRKAGRWAWLPPPWHMCGEGGVGVYSELLLQSVIYEVVSS